MIISRAQDKIKRSLSKNIPEALGFLTPHERAEIEKLNLPRHFFYGRDYERTFLFLLPDYLEEDNFPIEDYICAISAKQPFGNPTHRDFLGALLGLGIERECVGDIIVGEEESFFFVTRKIAPFVLQNLDKVGRLGVKVKEVPVESVPDKNEPYNEIEASVASLRLDALASAAFNISRSAAAQGIEAGLVSLNFLSCENPAKQLCEGDVISFRGHGRAKIAVLGNFSKKGRQFVKFHTFVKK